MCITNSKVPITLVIHETWRKSKQCSIDYAKCTYNLSILKGLSLGSEQLTDNDEMKGGKTHG